jgi:viroplasmin and RNaseH domain-containing protein
MKKINFTESDLNNLRTLIADFVLGDITFKGQLGNVIFVHDLIHNTSINSLRKIFTNLSNIAKNQQTQVLRWDSKDEDDQKTELLKKQINFVELLIGYKIFLAQNEDIEAQKLRIQEQIARVESSTKTPEDIIKELKDQLVELEG